MRNRGGACSRRRERAGYGDGHRAVSLAGAADAGLDASQRSGARRGRNGGEEDDPSPGGYDRILRGVVIEVREMQLGIQPQKGTFVL